jgi:hypothetical protein
MLHRFLTSRREVTLIKAWWCLVFRACNTNKMPWIIFSQFLTLQVTVNLLNILKIYPHMMFNGNLTLSLQIGPHLWRSSFVSFIFLLSFYFFTIASCQRLYIYIFLLSCCVASNVFLGELFLKNEKINDLKHFFAIFWNKKFKLATFGPRHFLGC